MINLSSDLIAKIRTFWSFWVISLDGMDEGGKVEASGMLEEKSTAPPTESKEFADVDDIMELLGE